MELSEWRRLRRRPVASGLRSLQLERRPAANEVKMSAVRLSCDLAAYTLARTPTPGSHQPAIAPRLLREVQSVLINTKSSRQSQRLSFKIPLTPDNSRQAPPRLPVFARPRKIAL